MRNVRWATAAAILAAGIPLVATARGGGLPPEESLARMVVHPELVVELVAAEPLLADPVAIDFDPSGDLWVAEMPDYTRGVDEHFDQHGAVKRLKDVDGDGRFDEAVVFDEGLRFPTDVKAWGRGVIVCDAPDVIYLEDADGDGRADVRKTLLTGFATFNAQARVNSLRWGLDNWVHASCGLFGGKIKTFTGQEADLEGRDFQFRPDSGEIAPRVGRTQQGLARDDWGNWFGCENGSLVKHYPLTDRYLARNPHLVPPPGEIRLPRGAGQDALFPIARPTLYQLSGPPGRPTSACGLEIYRDDLLGADFAGNAFTCEPVNQLVHRSVLKPQGVSFDAVRAPEESDREILASTDEWFRPVQVRTGTDGCLWIVDMYRAVIEHPRWIPEETLRELELAAGNSQGRIYRVRRRDVPPRSPLKLHELTAVELAAAIDSPNGPQRDMAQQLLVERRATEAASALGRLAISAARPVVRLQALCSLEGLGVLQASHVKQALADEDIHVRCHAVRLWEQFAAAGDAKPLAPILASLGADEAPLALQLAYTLGEVRTAETPTALATIARRYASDPYIAAAVFSSLSTDTIAGFTDELLKNQPAQLPAGFLQSVLKMTAALGDDACVAGAVARIGRDDGAFHNWQLQAIAALAQSLGAGRLSEIRTSHPTAAHVIDRTYAAALDRVDEYVDDDGPAMLPVVQLLAVCAPDPKSAASALTALLEPRFSPAVQTAAVDALAAFEASLSAEPLLSNWRTFTPAMQSHVLNVCLARKGLSLAVIEMLKTGELTPAHFTAVQRQQLLSHADAAIRDQAAVALREEIKQDRQQVVEAYHAVRDLTPHVGRGRDVFNRHCSSCHQIEGIGFSVGPDLTALTNRTETALLESIFDPNRALDERYRSYLAVGDDGRSQTGILVGETATSITLLAQEGKQSTLLRNSLEMLENTGVSLMPEGLEKDINVQDAADLLAYLRTQGQAPKEFPGNVPKLIEPDKDGGVRLLAKNAEIFGEAIRFENGWNNIGYWNGDDDHVAWNVVIDAEQLYDVRLEWASADEAAGNIAIIEGFDAPIIVKVEGTGGFERYHIAAVAQRRLSGQHRIVVRANEPLKGGSLMDLRGLHLAPARKDANVDAPAVAEIRDLLARTSVGTPEEYAQIPDIWKASIIAGRRNDSEELKQLLDQSLPALGEPLHHWQAVVIGGGVINGLTQIGAETRERIAALIKGDEQLRGRWKQLMDLSIKMADDPAVRPGTRYDALRILGMERFDRVGKQLVKYLAADAHGELQMGAVSALGDMREPAATDALVGALATVNEGNRNIAFVALIRTEYGANALLEALERGRIEKGRLTAEQIKVLKDVKFEGVKD